MGRGKGKLGLNDVPKFTVSASAADLRNAG